MQALHQGRELQAGMHDQLCTATHFVARAVAASLRRFLPGEMAPDRVLLSGGGVRNGLLWRLLEQQMPDGPIGRTDEAGVPVGMRKAMSFGLLAALTVDGVERQLAVGHGRRRAFACWAASRPDRRPTGCAAGVDGGPIAGRNDER